MIGPTVAIIAFFLTFASQHSGLPIPEGVQPNVILTAEFEGYPIGFGKTYYALTSRVTGQIALPTSWTANVLGYCALAHELTHWLQFVQGGLGPGKSSRDFEPAAYQVEADCYEQYGMWRYRQIALRNAETMRR